MKTHQDKVKTKQEQNTNTSNSKKTKKNQENMKGNYCISGTGPLFIPKY